eukprot:s3600_g6.t1
MAEMADFAATSLGSPGRFQQLIAELVAQHDREVQLLQSENEQLREQIISVGIDYAHEETHGLKLEIEQLNEEVRRLRLGADRQEPCMEHPLREEATQVLRGPPTITIDCLEELPEVCQGEVEPENGLTRAAPETLESDESSKPKFSESPRESPDAPDAERESIRESVELNRVSLSRAVSHEDQVLVVRAIAYTVQLPGSALPGDWDPAEGKMVVTVKCGEMRGDIPIKAALQQEVPEETALPHQISNDVTWAAAWEEEGGDVLMHVPQSMLDKSIPFDLQTVGSAIRIGSGRMQLNCTRQQWILDCGGFLESEIHIEKATTPAGMRRTSQTTRARIIERLEKLFDVKDGAAKVVMPADLGLAMKNAALLNAKTSKRQSAKFESRLAQAPCHNYVTESNKFYHES